MPSAFLRGGVSLLFCFIYYIIFQSRTQAFFVILFIDFSMRNNRFFILYAKRIFFENRDIIFSGVWLPHKNGAEA